MNMFENVDVSDFSSKCYVSDPHTPVRPTLRVHDMDVAMDGEELVIPSAPGAPQRARTHSRLSQPLFNTPFNLKATMQYSSCGVGAPPKNMKLMVNASSQNPPDVIELVLAVDVSRSMGTRAKFDSRMGMVCKFLEDFVNDGLPGQKLMLRLVTFAREATVLASPDDFPGLFELNDLNRGFLLKQINGGEKRWNSAMGESVWRYHIDGVGHGTDIGDAVMKSLDVLKAERAKETRDFHAPVQHVVVLTDGESNLGTYQDGDSLRTATVNKIGDAGVFVHFIGLGTGVNADFMTRMTKNGNLGVFAEAPKADQVADAYERVIGCIASTSDAFDIIVSAGRGIEKHRLGMLTEDREATVDVVVGSANFTGKIEIGKVWAAKNGKTIGEPIALFMTFDNSMHGLGEENEAVRDHLQTVKVNAERDRIMSTDGIEIAEVARQLEAQEEYIRNNFGRRALNAHRANSATVAAMSNQPHYRSLRGNGVALVAAQMSSAPMSSQEPGTP